jgi:hypothetical protein
MVRRTESPAAGVVGLIVYFGFVAAGNEGLGTMIAGFATAMAIAIVICQPLRGERWFWGVVARLVAVHAAVVLLFDRRAAARWSGLTFIRVMFGDALLILAVVYAAYRALYGAPSVLVQDHESAGCRESRDSD